MDMSKISAGKDLPHDFNVVIEIPAQSDPVKYEVDKESGALLVDRFIGTSMRYPANYGFIRYHQRLIKRCIRKHSLKISPSGKCRGL